VAKNCNVHVNDMLRQNMKYILVIGGVISGVGKGIVASSIGTILKANGVRVTSIKIDPYINIDAGTFSPYEHGTYAVFFLVVWFLVLIYCHIGMIKFC